MPAYNEASVIASVIEEVRKEGYFHIVVINDGSSDDTSKILKEINVRELKMPINRGVGAAMRLGIIFARANGYQHLVFIDADGQHFPSDIEKLYDKMQETGVDLVIGSRFHKDQSSVPLIRRIYNKIANLLTLLGQTKVKDSQSGFRILNRRSIEKLELELDDYGICTEMIWKCRKNKLTMSETPISVRYTEYSLGKGQNFIKGVKTGYSLIKKI